jgi:hypothetical protein
VQLLEESVVIDDEHGSDQAVLARHVIGEAGCVREGRRQLALVVEPVGLLAACWEVLDLDQQLVLVGLEPLLRGLVLDEGVEVGDDKVDALLLVRSLVEVREAPLRDRQLVVNGERKLPLELEAETVSAVVLRPERRPLEVRGSE